MPEVARTVGRYEIVRRLGRGGMAVVHLARQPELDRLVALKELSALRADDPSYAHRFLRESRLAGSLAHPNIVTVFDYFEHEGTPYIAMEYVDGGSLRSYLGQLSLAQIGGVLEGLTAGLMYAEECEIVHRDLKPENVMVTRHGRVKIADFGIAKATNTLYTTKWLTETGMTVGTPGYMAPEQAMGLTVGPGTDLYSLGCMAYEIFVGQVPFADSGTPMALLIRHINETVPPAHSVDPDVPAEVSAWIERLLIKEPDDRMPSAADAWDEFEDILFTLVGPRWRRESRLVAARDGGRFAQPRPATEPPEDGERRSSSASWQTFRGPGGEPVPGPYTPPPEDVLSQPSLVPPAERVPGPYTPPPADAVDDPSPATSDYETFVAPPPDRPPVDDFSAVEEDATPVAAEPAPVEPELPPTEAVPTPPAAATAPPAAATAPPAAATAPSAATVRPSRPAVRRRRAAVGVVIALIAAAAAVVVLTSSGDDPKPGPAAAKLAKLSAGPAALDAPAGWRPVASARQLGRGFTLKPASLAAQGGDPSKGVLAVGLAPRSAHNPTLVAPELIRSLGLRRGVTPDSEIVRLSGSGREALRYSGLRPPGRDQVATVYAVPTSGGVVTVECVSPLPAPASMEADCSRAASSLRLSGTAYPPRPSRAFAEQVNAALVPLTRTLSSARRSLGGASSARRQASAAQQISRAYSAAAQVAARDSVSPFDEQSRDALTAGLRAAATGFGALATAAGRSSKQAYADATLRATRGEAGVGSALDRLRAGGYKDLVTPTPGRTDIPKLEQRHRAKPQPTQSAQRSSASQSPSPTPNPTPGTGTSGTGQGSGDDSTGSGSFGGTIGGNK